MRCCIIEIEDKNLFAIGIVFMAYQLGFESLSITIFNHIWPLCAFGYIAGILIIVSGIKGHSPSILTSVIVSVVVIMAVGFLFILSANGIIF